MGVKNINLDFLQDRQNYFLMNLEIEFLIYEILSTLM